MSCSPKSVIQKYGVIVIESLPADELQTGTRLYNDLLQFKPLIDREFFAELHVVKTREEFFSELQHILNELEDTTMISIHIEAHGGETGIQLAFGEIITWRELHDVLRPINIKLLGLLPVAIATCYSFPFTWSIDITQRSSFKTVVFTKRDMTAGEIERGFLAYYDSFSNLLDFNKALNAIQNEVNEGNPRWSPFQMMVADWAFDQISEPDNNPNFQEVVMTQFARMRDSHPNLTPVELENDMRKRFAFIREHGRDFFLCKDLIQE